MTENAETEDSLDMTLPRDSGVALWRQIADRLRLEMTELADKDGRLPTEMQLAERFGVNRLTLRSAVTNLVHEGLLRREQGRGTFIEERPKLKYPISKRTRFSEGFAKQAIAREMIVLDSALETLNKAQSAALNLPLNAPGIRVDTVALADNIPVIRGTHYYCAQRFAGIETLVNEHRSITKALRNFDVYDYFRKWTEVEARLAAGDDITDLRLSPGSVVLVATALNVDASHTPIQYSISRMRADRLTLRMENDL